jgi:predicted nucleotidyltransferase
MNEDALRRTLAADARIAYALLFGSVARGTETPFSDVDIAIGLTPGTVLSAYDIGGIVSALEMAVERDVDLVILDKAPPPLAYRVFRDGRLLVEKDRAARVKRQADAIVEYLDFKPIEDLYVRGILEAARRNG